MLVGVDDGWSRNSADRIEQAGRRVVRISVKNPLADGVLMAYRAGKTLKNETVAWIDGEDVDWRQVFSSILRGVGPATGLPTGQLETSGKFVYDVASGEFEPEDATDLKYLFKRRPEE